MAPSVLADPELPVENHKAAAPEGSNQEQDNAERKDTGSKPFLQRRNTFTDDGMAIECQVKTESIEPSYYSRERIVFHLGRLLKEFPFFHDMDHEIQAQLPAIVSYAFHPEGHVFFNEGDAADQCHIVLTGRVDIWKSHAEHDEPPSGLHRHASEHPSGRSKASVGGDKSGSASIQRKCASIAHMLAAGTDSHCCTPTSPKSPTSPHSAKGHHSPKSPHGFKGKRKTLAQKFASNSSSVVDGLFTPHSHIGDTDEEGEPKVTKVATLGAGCLFGELALLEDQPRNATILCRDDCEVLTISSADFSNVLKMHLKKEKNEKIAFLRRHVPGMAELPERRIEDYAYLFKPSQFPKNHFFVRQGANSDGLLHFLLKGCVEFRMASMHDVPVFSGLPEVAHRRLGCLAPGGMFGSLVPNRYEPFSIVATTSQCDIYQLCAQDMRRLPESILRLLKDVLEHQNSWRINRCDSPAGNILGVVPQTVPCFVKNRQGKKSRPRKMLPVELRDAHANDTWDMAPGEIIALKGKLPRMLPGGSKSMPLLPPAIPDSRQPSRISSALPASRMSSASRRPPMSRPASSMAGSSIVERL